MLRALDADMTAVVDRWARAQRHAGDPRARPRVRGRRGGGGGVPGVSRARAGAARGRRADPRAARHPAAHRGARVGRSSARGARARGERGHAALRRARAARARPPRCGRRRQLEVVRRRGAEGPVADVPPPLDVQTVPDAPPRAEILAPAADTVVAPDAMVTLRLAASDDHGLARAIVRTGGRRTAGPNAGRRAARWRSPARRRGRAKCRSISRRARWNPGDALHVLFVVTDDSPVAADGPEPRTRDPRRRRSRKRAPSRGRWATARRRAPRMRPCAEGTHAPHAGSGAHAGGPQHRHEAREPGERPTSRTMSYETAERAAVARARAGAARAAVRDAQQETKALERALKEAGALDTARRGSCAMSQKLLGEALTPEMARQLAGGDVGVQEAARPRRCGARSSSSRSSRSGCAPSSSAPPACSARGARGGDADAAR